MTTDAHPPKLNYAQKTLRAMNREVQIICAAVRSPPQFIAKALAPKIFGCFFCTIFYVNSIN